MFKSASVQIGQGATGKVRGAQAVADIAAGPSDSAILLMAHGGAPVSGNAKRAVPAVGDNSILRLGKEVDHRLPHPNCSGKTVPAFEGRGGCRK